MRTTAHFQNGKAEIGARAGPVTHVLCCSILTFLQLCIDCDKYLSYGIKEHGCNR